MRGQLFDMPAPTQQHVAVPDDAVRTETQVERVAAPRPPPRTEVASAAAYLALEAPASMTGAVLDINGASYVR